MIAADRVRRARLARLRALQLVLQRAGERDGDRGHPVPPPPREPRPTAGARR